MTMHSDLPEQYWNSLETKHDMSGLLTADDFEGFVADHMLATFYLTAFDPLDVLFNGIDSESLPFFYGDGSAAVPTGTIYASTCL